MSATGPKTSNVGKKRGRPPAQKTLDLAELEKMGFEKKRAKVAYELSGTVAKAAELLLAADMDDDVDEGCQREPEERNSSE